MTVLCLSLMVFLVRTKKKLAHLQRKSKKENSVQKTFTQAVAGIEATLEQEKSNSARLLHALETIQDGVALMDRKGALQYANAALWKLYAIPPANRKSYMNVSWLNLHSPKGQDDILTKVLPILEKSNVWIGENNVLAQDGKLIRAELYISKARDGYIGFIRDVSDRYKAEKENTQLSLQLQQLQKFEAIERIVRSVIHDFSNGLSAVIGLSEILCEDLPDNSYVQNYSTKICTAGLQMQATLEKAKFLLPEGRKFSEFSGFLPTTEVILPVSQEGP